MDIKLSLWTMLFCAGLSLWFYLEIDRGPMNYPYFKNLWNASSSTYKPAVEQLNVTRVILEPEEYMESTNPIQRLNYLIQAYNFETPFSMDQEYIPPVARGQTERGNESDQSLIVDETHWWPQANQSLCGHQLKWLLEKLTVSNYKLIKGKLGAQLTEYVDTFGKPDAGLYTGNVFSTGSYRACIRSQIDQHPGQPIRMHYCVARFRYTLWDQMEPDKSEPEARIRMGICLPMSCTQFSFKEYGKQIEELSMLDFSEHFRRDIYLKSITCLPDEQSEARQITPSGWIYIKIVSAWISFIILVSLLYEFYLRGRFVKASDGNEDTSAACGEKQDDEMGEGKRNWFRSLPEFSFKEKATAQSDQNIKTSVLENLNQDKKETMIQEAYCSNRKSVRRAWWFELLESLSLRHSLKSFKEDTFKVRHKLGQRVRVNLSILNSVKIMMALTIILGHSNLFNIIYCRHIRAKFDLLMTIIGRLSIEIVRCVDTYFVFSGVLTSFTILRKVKPDQLGNPLLWIAINAGILLRVGPIFMLAYWFSHDLGRFLSAGPWWDYGNAPLSMRGLCLSEPWWKSIPYFSNLGSTAVTNCVPQGWFVTSYVQISLILPLLTYILYNMGSSLKRFGLVLFICSVSCGSLLLKVNQQTAISPVAFHVIPGLVMTMVEKYETSGYLTTLGRAGSSSVGALIGYLLHMYQIGHIKRWPKWFRNPLCTLIWFSILLLLVTAPIIGHFISKATGEFPSMLTTAVSGAIISFIWPWVVGALILDLCTTRNRNVVLRFFSHSFWHAFNRLGLLIFMVHWEILVFVTLSFEHGPGFAFMTDSFKGWAFGAFFSIIVSFLLFIILEAPLSRIVMLLLSSVTGKTLPKFAVGQKGDGNNQKPLSAAHD